jgi:hypothetical protein
MKAFPHIAKVHMLDGNSIIKEEITSGGMDLRDYFAAKATEQDIQPFLWESVGPRSAVQTCTREEAKYKYADAMIKAREAK